MSRTNRKSIFLPTVAPRRTLSARALIAVVLVAILAAVAPRWIGQAVAAPVEGALSAAVAAARAPAVSRATPAGSWDARVLAQSFSHVTYLPLVRSGAPANRAPHPPTAPEPAHGTGEQPVTLTLRWAGGDPDGDSITYTLYLEADDKTPDTAYGQTSEPAMQPRTLRSGTLYYWRIVATDMHGANTLGPVWSFATQVEPISDAALEVVRLTNAHRTASGCPELALSPQLTRSAQRHSDDMAYNDFFGHAGSDGTTPWQRIEDTGYTWANAAENIAAGFPTPRTVVDAWMASAGHRANILNCDLTEIGVGYAYFAADPGNEQWRYYWTQDLARPQE